MEYSGECRSHQCVVYAVYTNEAHGLDETKGYILLVYRNNGILQKSCAYVNRGKWICDMAESMGWRNDGSFF